MKRVLALLLALVLLLANATAYISAAEIPRSQTQLSPDSDSPAIQDASDVSKRKVYTLFNTNDEPIWKVTLVGSFTYDSTDAACGSSNCSVTIYHDGWEILSKEITRSGATTTVNLTMGYKILGINLLTKSIQMSLTCDKDGNFS